MNDVLMKNNEISLRSILDSFLVNPILFLLLKLKLTPNAVTFLGYNMLYFSIFHFFWKFFGRRAFSTPFFWIYGYIRWSTG